MYVRQSLLNEMKQSQVKEDKSKTLKITMIEKQNSKINEQSKTPAKKGA